MSDDDGHFTIIIKIKVSVWKAEKKDDKEERRKISIKAIYR